jgi:hypothetical protein
MDEDVALNYVKVNKNVKYGEDVLVPMGSVGTVIMEKGDDWTVKFEDTGVIVTSHKDDFKVVSSRKTKVNKFIINSSMLDNESRLSIENGICPICSGLLVIKSVKKSACSNCDAVYKGLFKKAKDEEKEDDKYAIGKAVRIEGNPASPYYGQTGIIQDLRSDDWVGINIAGTDYIQRLKEDLVPAPKLNYVKDHIKSE